MTWMNPIQTMLHAFTATWSVDILNINMLSCVSRQLRKSYGDVYSLFIGSKPAVVINGLKAIKEAMVIKAADFAGRPQDLFINDVTQKKGRVGNTVW